MLRTIRIILAVVSFALITLLFLDFTGTLHLWFGWLAKIQFLPALLALNVSVIVFLLAQTLLFGRIYCSVLCPLGVFQDLVSWISGKRKKKKYRFSYSPAVKWLRYGVLGIFIIVLIAGIGSLVSLFAPYSAYGRIASNMFAPFWQWGNNLLAYFAERTGSYAFYETEVWAKSLPTFIIAAVTFILLVMLAWRNGRTYCNTICPVGTVLGFLSMNSLLRPVIDTHKCNGCGLCSRKCKAACINTKAHQIDYSRCVTCLDCVGVCRRGALKYQLRTKGLKPDTIEQNKMTSQRHVNQEQINEARRHFLTGVGVLTATATVKAQEKKVDGGLAVILDKKIPDRFTSIVPPGAGSSYNMSTHCTGCQLCISVCPNGVLRPSTGLSNLMQPEVSYERGYCRPECVKCSEVCPAGAIRKITLADKSSVQIGHAVWVKANCIVLTDKKECGNCARHCPTGAIVMIPSEVNTLDSLKIPSVNVERCIGCGACENLCPARPFSAIYVEGHERHRIL